MAFTDRHWSKINVLRVIMRVILSLSFEYRAGRLKRDEMPELETSRITRMMRGDKAKKTKIDELETRYPEIEFDQKFIGVPELTALLFDGRVEISAIQESLDRSPPFAAAKSEPPWRRVINMYVVDSGEFEQALVEMERQFNNHEIVIPGEMFHVFGLRLFLSEAGFISNKKR